MYTLPSSPNLEQLKNQAKDLLRAYRLGDQQAQLRMQAHLPRPNGGASTYVDGSGIRLSDALLVVAREYGFPSWQRLRAFVVAARAAQDVAPEMRSSPPPVETPSRIEQKAERLIAFAQQRDVERVLATIFAPLRDMLAVRAYLVEHQAHAIVVDTLLEGLADPRPRLRFAAAQAMDHFADQRCEQPLRQLLDDPVPRVRWAAIHSLSCDGCKIAPLTPDGDMVGRLIELATTDPSIRVRRVAAYTLGGYCSDPRTSAALESLLARETDRAVVRNTRWALGQQQRAAPKPNEA